MLPKLSCKRPQLQIFKFSSPVITDVVEVLVHGFELISKTDKIVFKFWMLIIKVNIALPEDKLRGLTKFSLGDRAIIILEDVQGVEEDIAKLVLDDVLGNWAKLVDGEKFAKLLFSLFFIVLEDNFAKVTKHIFKL